MDNSNVHILSTATLEQPLIDKAAQQGIMVDVVPFISVTPVSPLPGMDALCAQSLTVIFTSANAVRIIGEQLQSNIPRWEIYCIGNATQQAVLQYFDAGAISGMAESAVLLANEIIRRGGTGNVVFFCGDKRRDDLPVMLVNSGIIVNEIVVYSTVETPETIEKKYDGILFFSPSAVSSFFKINTVPDETVLFAIGSTTALAAKEHSGNNIITSESPAKEEVIAAVIKYYNKEQ